jgi:hypothetical protein
MKRWSTSTTALVPVENKEVEQVEDPTKYNIKLLSHIQSTEIDPETKNKPFVVKFFFLNFSKRFTLFELSTNIGLGALKKDTTISLI